MPILTKQRKATAWSPVVNGQRLLTAADLAVFPDDLPSGTVKYELHNGKLVIMPPPGDIHGAAQAKFTGRFLTQCEDQGLGKVRTETGVILWRNPDHVLGPDVSFIATRSLPIRTSPEGYLETIPDLVVEVRSKNDTDAEIAQKVKDYLKAGVILVWVADPKAKTVTGYRRGRRPHVFREADALTAEDILPGFRVLVRGVFQL